MVLLVPIVNKKVISKTLSMKLAVKKHIQEDRINVSGSKLTLEIKNAKFFNDKIV